MTSNALVTRSRSPRGLLADRGAAASVGATSPTCTLGLRTSTPVRAGTTVDRDAIQLSRQLCRAQAPARPCSGGMG